MVNDDDSEADRPFWSRPGFILAGVLIAGVAVLGIILGLTAGTDDEPTPAQPAVTAPAPPETATPSVPPDDAAATTTPSSTPEPAAAADCPQLPGGDPEAALTTGPEVQWSPVGEVAAAFSEDHGPAARDGIKSCYAPTSTGALLAAYNFFGDFRTWSLDPVEVVESRFSSDSAQYAEVLEAAVGAANLREVEQRETLTAQGYRFLETSPDEYTIALIHTLNRPTGVVFTQDETTVSWNGSDWVVSQIADIVEVSELPPEFIVWGPTSENTE